MQLIKFKEFKKGQKRNTRKKLKAQKFQKWNRKGHTQENLRSQNKTIIQIEEMTSYESSDTPNSSIYITWRNYIHSHAYCCLSYQVYTSRAI